MCVVRKITFFFLRTFSVNKRCAIIGGRSTSNPFLGKRQLVPWQNPPDDNVTLDMIHKWTRLREWCVTEPDWIVLYKFPQLGHDVEKLTIYDCVNMQNMDGFGDQLVHIAFQACPVHAVAMFAAMASQRCRNLKCIEFEDLKSSPVQHYGLSKLLHWLLPQVWATLPTLLPKVCVFGLYVARREEISSVGDVKNH